MSNYRSRTIDKLLQAHLKAFGAVCLVGAKGVGKTTTCQIFARSEDRLQNHPDKAALTETIKANPKIFLTGEKPHLIDEWQDAPVLWDLVRNYCDEHPEKGNFLLTGSTSKKIKTAHTGTTRISTLKMYPMSLYESGDSSGEVSLTDLFDGKADLKDGLRSKKTLEDIVYLAQRGGWPSSLYVEEREYSTSIAEDYYNQIHSKDMFSVDEKKRSQAKMEAVLKSYARNVSTPAKKSAIYLDAGIDEATLDDYLDVLERLYVIEDCEAFNPNIRSASTMRKGRKREFVDPSLAIASLGVDRNYLLRDMRTFGFIFECMAIRDLRALSLPQGGKVLYYRDSNGLEADAVLFLKDGRYGLIEIKLGSAYIEEGAKNLNKLENDIKKAIEEKRAGVYLAPSFKMIITADIFAYRREDGVYVVPLACLRD